LALISGIKEPVHIPLENFSLEQAEQLQNTLQFDLLKQQEVEDYDCMPLHVCHHPSSMLVVLNELWCKVIQPTNSQSARILCEVLSICQPIYTDLL
jgi:hypothetical protein